MTDDKLDTLLRDAMAARPEPPDATNLAARAIAMSRAERRAPTPSAAPVAAPVARVFATLFAAASMLVVLVLGYSKLAALIAANAATSVASSTTYTSEVAPMLAVGGVGLVIALAYVVLRGSLSIEDDSFRID